MKRMIAAAFALAVAVSAGCGGGSSPATRTEEADTLQVTAVPAPPTTVTGIAGVGTIIVAWNGSGSATSYNVYYSKTPGVIPATGARLSVASPPCPLTGLDDETTYYYVVTGVNAAGESLPSSEISSTTYAANGMELYETYCTECHGPHEASTIRNGLPDEIKKAIAENKGGMGRLSFLNDPKIYAISAIISAH